MGCSCRAATVTASPAGGTYHKHSTKAFSRPPVSPCSINHQVTNCNSLLPSASSTVTADASSTTTATTAPTASTSSTSAAPPKASLPYQCMECAREFADVPSLKAHRLEHLKERPFKWVGEMQGGAKTAKKSLKTETIEKYPLFR